MALAQELGPARMQLHALRLIEPGMELPMSALAGLLFCDASNVTGIVDRLEARGVIEGRPGAAGPPEIARCRSPSSRGLRDALRAALEQTQSAAPV